MIAVGEDHPSTEELRAVQRRRAETERQLAGDAPTEELERAHERRADKAGYLAEKLAEQERSERS